MKKKVFILFLVIAVLSFSILPAYAATTYPFSNSAFWVVFRDSSGAKRAVSANKFYNETFTATFTVSNGNLYLDSSGMTGSATGYVKYQKWKFENDTFVEDGSLQTGKDVKVGTIDVALDSSADVLYRGTDDVFFRQTQEITGAMLLGILMAPIKTIVGFLVVSVVSWTAFRKGYQLLLRTLSKG